MKIFWTTNSVLTYFKINIEADGKGVSLARKVAVIQRIVGGGNIIRRAGSRLKDSATTLNLSGGTRRLSGTVFVEYPMAKSIMVDYR